MRKFMACVALLAVSWSAMVRGPAVHSRSSNEVAQVGYATIANSPERIHIGDDGTLHVHLYDTQWYRVDGDIRDPKTQDKVQDLLNLEGKPQWRLQINESDHTAYWYNPSKQVIAYTFKPEHSRIFFAKHINRYFGQEIVPVPQQDPARHADFGNPASSLKEPSKSLKLDKRLTCSDEFC